MVHASERFRIEDAASKFWRDGNSDQSAGGSSGAGRLCRHAAARRLARGRIRGRASVVRDDAEDGRVDRDAVVVRDEPEVPELVHEEIHACPRRPDRFRR